MPVCKQSEESPHSYLESDTVWINTSKSAGQGAHRSLPYQDSSHLYVNKICPPEYSELEGQSASYRNMNHCSPMHGASQGQYYASTNIMERLNTCSEPAGGAGAPPQIITTGDTVSSCSSQSRHSESYKLSGSDSSQGSGPGPGRYMSDDLIRHVMAGNSRATDPGLPPPVPPLRGPSSYSAGIRAASSFNSFGLQSSGEIYGYRSGPHFYSPPCNNHYETASIYQDTDWAIHSRPGESPCP